MLLIRVELHPGGDSVRAKTIATARIGNISDLADVSDYVVRAQEIGAQHLGVLPRESEFRIEGHLRKQSVWALVAAVARRAYEQSKTE